MAKQTKTIEWYELGFWSVDEDGRNAEWHVVCRYAPEAKHMIEGDTETANKHWPDATFTVRMKRIEVVIG